MSFLQPILLAGLPLIGLPILIHLINQWRHKTLPWGAMMFLLDAKRMNRGMARLRFWLIMAMRMLAVAALFLAMARPLTSGWLGLAVGGQAETTIVILDRSASMEQQELATARSKRSAALTQVADVLRSAGSGSRLVLIESATESARELTSPDDLLESLDTAGTATTADLPGLMQKALDFVVANETGRTDIWVCSDRRENDWKAGDSRWSSVRDGFQTLEGVKFYLLSYAEPARDNVAVQVANVRQRGTGEERELIFDVQLTRSGEEPADADIPCEFVINGVRSVVNITLIGNETQLQGHQVPLSGDNSGGWGRVELPADENLLDNAAYFVFADPPVHHTTIVAEDPDVAEALRVAATAPLDLSIKYTSEFLPVPRAEEIDFGASSLILWQAPLPEGLLADQLRGHVEGGRPIVFFPSMNEAPAGGGPASPAFRQALFDVAWGDWRRAGDDEMVRVATWRGDSDVWAHSASGEPLGIGDLRVYAYRQIVGTAGSPLARLDGGDPLLYRTDLTGGAAYFCATLPLSSHSSLAQDGLAFYALIQRALSRGAATQSLARDVPAGSLVAQQVTDWQPSDPASRGRLLSSRWLQAGAYESGTQRLALNRPDIEDRTATLNEEDVDTLFAGLDAHHVTQSLASAGALTSEVWRAILLIMGLALIVEAFLCMPERRREVVSARPEGSNTADVHWQSTSRESPRAAKNEVTS